MKPKSILIIQTLILRMNMISDDDSELSTSNHSKQKCKLPYVSHLKSYRISSHEDQGNKTYPTFTKFRKIQNERATPFSEFEHIELPDSWSTDVKVDIECKSTATVIQFDSTLTILVTPIFLNVLVDTMKSLSAEVHI